MLYRYLQNKEHKKLSREKRKKLTDAERLFWLKVRNRQLLGYKFRRQFPFGNYILDFYCPEKRIAIELDGSHHLKKKKYDLLRTKYLRFNNIRTIRFWDNEVLTDINGVLYRLYKVLTKS